jgi:hypothetical protein
MGKRRPREGGGIVNFFFNIIDTRYLLKHEKALQQTNPSGKYRPSAFLI